MTGTWGSLSKVTGEFTRDTPILTQDTTPLLDQDGQQIPDKTIAGATTIELTPDEVKQARTPNQLWAQGGTPDDPVLDQTYPGQYGFGALRCAIDALNGDNVEYIFFPEGVSHVFCYGLYVQPPPTSGTITILKKVHNAPAGENPSFPFSGNISYDLNGFQLRDRESKDFFRAGGATWTVTEGDVANYRLDGVNCTSAASKQEDMSTFTVNGATAQIDLKEGDHATCVYHNVYVPPPGGLTIRKVTLGGVGNFSYTVTASPTAGEIHWAEATTTQPGVPVDAVPSLTNLAPGQYVIAEQKPTSPDGRWHLLDASCNGAKRSTTKPFTVDIKSGQSVVCTSSTGSSRAARSRSRRSPRRHRHYVVQGRAGGRTARAVSADCDDDESGGGGGRHTQPTCRRHRSPSPRHLSHRRTVAAQLDRRLDPDLGRVQWGGDPVRPGDGDDRADPQGPPCPLCVHQRLLRDTAGPPDADADPPDGVPPPDARRRL